MERVGDRRSGFTDGWSGGGEFLEKRYYMGPQARQGPPQTRQDLRPADFLFPLRAIDNYAVTVDAVGSVQTKLVPDYLASVKIFDDNAPPQVR